MRPPVRCSHPGCRNLNCTEHGKRPSARQRGYDAAWEYLRKAFLEENPYCVECGKPATDVDHIDGRGPLGPRGYDWSNLQALCRSHHSRKTRQTTGWDE